MAGIFAIIFSVLVIYDVMVTKRQNRLMATAKKTDAIVASLFPKEIKDKMLAEAADNSNPVKRATATKCGLEDGGTERKIVKNSKPIADLFPETTIFFADIAGFTAWSSAREPAQVFTLLEVSRMCFVEKEIFFSLRSHVSLLTDLLFSFLLLAPT